MSAHRTGRPPSLRAVTFAYPQVATVDRERLAAALMRQTVPGRVFVLSTCLRVEVAVEGDDGDLEAALESVFGGAVPGSVIRRDREAVEHLFRVASGLESPVLGEVEVLAQFRDAAAAVVGRGELPGWMIRVLESAVAVGRVTRRVLPPSPYGSIADVAAEMVGGVDRVAILGSGVMASAVVDGLLALEPRPHVTLVARHTRIEPRDGLEVWPFTGMRQVLLEYPAVVSATSAKKRLLPDDELAGLLKKRSEPLTLVDMAMPPDFRPTPGLPVDYVQIDELASRVAAAAPVGEADDYVFSAAEEAWRRVQGAGAVAPVVERLYSDVDDIVERTVERFTGRLHDPADARILRQAVHTAARTILARPVARLSEVDRPDEHAVTLAEVFGIEDA